jgi:hypothetical protein
MPLMLVGDVTLSPSFYHRASEALSQGSCIWTTPALVPLKSPPSCFRRVSEDQLMANGPDVVANP